MARYAGRISGPLLDRFDLHLEVPTVPVEELGARSEPEETSAAIRERVVAARAVQAERLARSRCRTNADLGPKQIRQWASPDDPARTLLDAATSRLGLSARGYHRVLRVARTIADLGGAAQVGAEHVSEAIQYRTLDRPVSG